MGKSGRALRAQPQILIFDVDGVLVDVRDSYWRSALQTVQFLSGHRVTYKQLHEWKSTRGRRPIRCRSPARRASIPRTGRELPRTWRTRTFLPRYRPQHLALALVWERPLARASGSNTSTSPGGYDVTGLFQGPGQIDGMDCGCYKTTFRLAASGSLCASIRAGHGARR